jgi:guanylate kinase
VSSPTKAESGRSRLVVLAGPTAVGKGTVAARVREKHPEVWISVSVTTRRPRPGEIGGVHYHFVDDARFDEMIAAGDLLEWAVIHGAARYGTPRQPVFEALAEGRQALLEIDLQGARQIREAMPDAFYVFLAPADRSWHRGRRRTGAATRDGTRGAGCRVGVRCDHRQPRSRASVRGVGSLVAIGDRSTDPPH